MRRVHSLLVAAVALLVMSAHAADATVLCRIKATGLLVARPECLADVEKEITPAKLGIQRPLHVEDVNGANAGSVTELSAGGSFASIVRPVGGTLVILQVNQAGFRETGALSLFKTTDCSGHALMFKGVDSLAVVGEVRDGIAYFPTGEAKARPIAAALLDGFTEAECASTSGQTFYPPDKCCRPGFVSGTQVVAPQSSFDLSSLGLVPPFRLVGP